MDDGVYYGCSTFTYVNIQKFNGRYEEPKVDLSKFTLIGIPMYVNQNHWIGVLYSPANNTLLCYDSNSDSFPTGDLELIRQFIMHTFHVVDVKLINAAQCRLPRQNNASDCGVFVMAFFGRMCTARRPVFRAQHSEYFRMKYLLQAASGKLLSNQK